MNKYLVVTFIVGLLLLIACNNSSTPEINTPTPSISYTIGDSLPHDTASFTEGLEFYNNTLLESTGNYGKSKLIQLDASTGKVIYQHSLDAKFFGEGISVLNDTLYQMTYKEKTVLVYSAKDFKKIMELPLTTEGWGMTNDGKQLIVTDGSSNLYFYEPGTFKLLRQQAVTENGTPAVNINELEYINGYVYANQWQYNYILKIDPKTGEVVAKMDLTDVVNRIKAKAPYIDALNGIAYNPTTKKVYITGKYWPEILELQFSF